MITFLLFSALCFADTTATIQRVEPQYNYVSDTTNYKWIYFWNDNVLTRARGYRIRSGYTNLPGLYNKTPQETYYIIILSFREYIKDGTLYGCEAETEKEINKADIFDTVK